MLRAHLFQITVFSFLFLTYVHSCTPFYDLALSEQRRYLAYQQRGVPRPFIRPFYRKFLRNLMLFSRKRYPNTSLRNICFTETEVSMTLEKFRKKSTIGKQIRKLEGRFPHIAYLMESKVHKVPIDYRLERASKKSFNITRTFLERNDVTRAAHLPRTSRVLYDPARQKSLETYNMHASHAPKMRASKLVATVTGMVLTLEFMKVKRRNSVQLLRHTVAWLSTIFRALQEDGPDLEVPVLFLPFYEHAFMVLEQHASFTVPMVSAEVVEEEFGDVLDVYTHVDAWGRLEIMQWEGKGSIWTIEEVLFNTTVLGRLAEKIGFIEFDPADHPPYDADVESMDGWEMEVDGDAADRSRSAIRRETTTDGLKNRDLQTETTGVKNRHASSQRQRVDKGGVGQSSAAGTGWRTGSARVGGTCATPLYEHVELQVSNWEEGCCATICCNAMLMTQAGMKLAECCGDCNQLDCSVEGSRLELLATVHLEPYGCDEGGAVPVSL